MAFTEKEKRILHIVQKNLPDSLTPYADIAKATGASEEEVISLIRRLKENGAIRRFGAMIRHQKTDWTHNAMVAWKVETQDREAFADSAMGFRTISHIYYRPSPCPDWPYTLYTMIHGRTETECDDVIWALRRTWPHTEFQVLKTVAERKKVSMTYF